MSQQYPDWMFPTTQIDAWVHQKNAYDMCNRTDYCMIALTIVGDFDGLMGVYIEWDFKHKERYISWSRNSIGKYIEWKNKSDLWK
jgi:hypothetical protein